MSYSNITKRALAAAMKDLMAQRPFAKINVGDICEACGLNRKSFYYHFRDKYDLVNWIFQTEFIETLQESPTQDEWKMLEQLCRYFYDNRGFYRAALAIRGQNSFPEYFREAITPIVQAALMGILDQPADAGEQRFEFAATFYADAFLCAIIRWLEGRNPASAEVFSGQIMGCLELGAKHMIADPPATQSMP